MITKLYYFIKVAQTGNLTRAAQELFISQPALTMAIKRLEKELDVTLFEREGNRLILSPSGKKMLPYAENLYNDYTLLKSSLSTQKKPPHSIRLGSGISHAAKIVEFYMDKVYDGSIILQQYYDYYDLRNALLEHKVDFVFCTPPIVGPDIISKDIFYEPICALMNPSHPLTKLDILSIEDLTAHPLITLPKNFPMRVAIDRAFANANMRPSYSIEVDSIVISTMLNREQSRLVTLYPLSRARSVHSLSGLAYRPISEPSFKRVLGISWYNSSSISYLLEDIVRSTEEFYATSPLFQKWGSFPEEEGINFIFTPSKS